MQDNSKTAASNKDASFEEVKRSLELLDREVHTFLQIINDIKKMKDSVSLIQDRMIYHEEEIENKQNELEKLILSTNTLVRGIEEQSASVTEKLEKKADAMIEEIRKTVYDLQRRPYETDNKIKKAEERIGFLIDEKYAKHKTVTFVLSLIVLTTAAFTIISFYLR